MIHHAFLSAFNNVHRLISFNQSRPLLHAAGPATTTIPPLLIQQSLYGTIGEFVTAFVGRHDPAQEIMHKTAVPRAVRSMRTEILVLEQIQVFVGGQVQPRQLRVVNEHPSGEENVQSENGPANHHGSVVGRVVQRCAAIVNAEQDQKVDQVDGQQ